MTRPSKDTMAILVGVFCLGLLCTNHQAPEFVEISAEIAHEHFNTNINDYSCPAVAGCNQRTPAPGTLAIATNLSQRPTAYTALPLDVLTAATNVGTNLFDAVKYRVMGGIGIALLGDKETKFLRVMNVASNSPAELAGLRPGDYITHVNNRSVKNVAVTRAVDWVRGINGTTVKLTVQPSLAATSQVVTVRRISSMDSRQMLSR